MHVQLHVHFGRTAAEEPALLATKVSFESRCQVDSVKPVARAVARHYDAEAC